MVNVTGVNWHFFLLLSIQSGLLPTQYCKQLEDALLIGFRSEFAITQPIFLH